MRTTLITTDFRLASTKVLDALLLDHPKETFRIVFFHAFKLSDSISDLLLLSRRSRDYEQVSDSFYERLNKYKADYGHQIQSIGIEYFYGSTVAAFKNFMEAHSIDCIASDSQYAFEPLNKYSIDPKYLLDRVACERLVFDTSIIVKEEKQPTLETQILCY
jgi:hypothetical protein